MKRSALLSIFTILFLVCTAAGPVFAAQPLATGKPVLSVVKTTADSSIATGETVSYTITTTNSGTAPATIARLEDYLPFEGKWTEDSDVCQARFGFLLQCEYGTLDPGESSTVTVSAVVPATVCGEISNFATAFAIGVTGSHPKVNSDTVKVAVSCGGGAGALALTKTAGQASVAAGDSLTFILRVTNTGTAALNNVTITDPLASGIGWTENSTSCSIDGASGVLTCTFGTLAAGDTKTVTVTGQTSPTTCGVVANTATATASGLATGVSASAQVDVTCAPSLVLTKTADADPINAGQTLRFRITAANNGTGVMSAVRISDVLPVAPGLGWVIENVSAGGSCAISAGTLTCDMGNLASGASRQVVLASSTTAATCGTISNTATATSSTSEANTSDNTATAAVTVNCGMLMIDKAPLAQEVQSGQMIGFTITVSNTGSGALSNVRVTDPLPAGFAWTETSAECSISGGSLSCTYPTLAAGQSIPVTVSATSPAGTCGAVSNTASAVAGGMSAPVSDTASVNLLCSPLITLDKIAETDRVSPGGTLAFQMVVSNNGGGAADGVTLVDMLPSGPDLAWSFGSVTPGGSCAITGGTLSCSFGTLAPGASASVRVTSPAGPNSCGQISNVASASASNDPATATDVALIEVVCEPNITITKTAETPEISAGSVARYRLEIVSNGNATATQVSLNDVLPTLTGMAWTVEDVIGGGSCAINAGTLTCSFGDLAPGQTRTVVIASPTSQASCSTGEHLLTNVASVSATNEALGRQNDNVAAAEIRVNCVELACLPVPIYVNNFDTINPGPAGWSNYPISTTPNNLQTFLGEFGNQAVSLTVADPSVEGHNYIRVSYDLYVIRTWDGNTDDGIRGPDNFRFNLRNDSGVILRRPLETTFSNIDNWPFRPAFAQAYPGSGRDASYPPFTGAAEIRTLGYVYAGPRDAVYRMNYFFQHTQRNINIFWEAAGLQPLDDESWGIDNVNVEIYNCETLYENTIQYYLPMVSMRGAAATPMLTPNKLDDGRR